MTKEESAAQLQDVFYSIGGGSQYIRCEDVTAVPFYRLSEMNEFEVAVIVDGYPIGHRPRLLSVPWYQRFWNFLNMDVRDIWRLIVRKVK